MTSSRCGKVVARVVDLEHPFRIVNFASPSGLELKERQRELEAQGKVPREPALGVVGVEVLAQRP